MGVGCEQGAVGEAGRGRGGGPGDAACRQGLGVEAEGFLAQLVGAVAVFV